MHTSEQIEQAIAYIQRKTAQQPKVGLILGSGLGGLAEEIANPTIIPYEEIPHFAVSTVDMHAGQLVIGQLANRPVIAMQGRFHYYEGYSLAEVTFPVRVMKALGAEQLIVTNASGAINEAFVPGDLMLIVDHLNLLGDNPLIGPHDQQLGVRFPDMSQAYSPRLQKIAKQVAQNFHIPLQTGVYAAWNGPSFETPAEIRMLRVLGGDAVGMSTVPEVIAANHAGMEVLAISCISNMAAGILPQPITAEEVYEAAEQAKNKFAQLLTGILHELE